MDGVASDLMKVLIGMGPGGIIAAFMTWQWKNANDERRDLQDKMNQILRDTTESRVQLANALEKLAIKVGA